LIFDVQAVPFCLVNCVLTVLEFDEQMRQDSNVSPLSLFSDIDLDEGTCLSIIDAFIILVHKAIFEDLFIYFKIILKSQPQRVDIASVW